MRVESLNIGLLQKEIFDDKEIITGICGRPVFGPLHLGGLGFDGDGVGDLKNHGGPDKAVCVYSLDHYPRWEEVLEIKLPHAAFGENLSVSNLKEGDVCIVDIFQLGTAIVQISQPRQPCKTLAARYGRKDLVKLVVDTGLTGFYLRVLEEGIVERGVAFALKERDSRGVTVSFANHIFHHNRKSRGGIEKVLGVPDLSEAWKRDFRELKEKLES